MTDQDSWELAAKTLRESATVAVCCHVAPDGDALGSMLGLGNFLERQGKQVWTSWGSADLTVPYQYAFLAGADRISKPTELPDRVETFIAIDCGDIKRLDILQERFHAAGVSINIDHHLSNPGFADVNIVEPARASSSELAYELVKRLDGAVEKHEATCFYTGMVTDTGRFQFSNTNPETLRVAAELLEAGADHLQVAERVYQSASFVQLRVLGAMLTRAKRENGLVYSWLMLEDLGELGIEETEDFIDVLRSVRDIQVALLIKQQPSGGWKGSLRSRGRIDVSKVAQTFGGGGHAAAAGFNFKGGLEELIQKVREQLPAS